MKNLMLKLSGLNNLMKKNFIAFTPLMGALIFPLLVPITISKFGINYGIIAALFISSLWFIAMLRTSEMPH